MRGGTQAKAGAGATAPDRSVYLAIGELQRRAAESGEPASRDLAPYELKVFSQNGEDGVLDEILRRCGIGTGTFVEFGAGAGVEAVCVYLADVAGWAGDFIEADADLFGRLSDKYALSTRVTTTQAAITPQNAEQVFSRIGVAEEAEVVSIDIDGHDYWVWRALEHYRPAVVVMEYNGHLGTEPLALPLDAPARWDGTDRFGASIGALRALGARKGYRLVHCDLSGVNAFFVRHDLGRDRFPDEASVVLRAPNYLLQGIRHPPGTGRWETVDGS